MIYKLNLPLQNKASQTKDRSLSSHTLLRSLNVISVLYSYQINIITNPDIQSNCIHTYIAQGPQVLPCIYIQHRPSMVLDISQTYKDNNYINIVILSKNITEILLIKNNIRLSIVLDPHPLPCTYTQHRSSMMINNI